MPVVIGKITKIDATLSSEIVEGTLTVSGSYPTGTGDTLSFAGQDQIKSRTPPRFVLIDEFPAAGTLASGLVYGFAPGTTLANGQMQVFVGGASASVKMAQLGNVTYASVGAANIYFRAEFDRV